MAHNAVVEITPLGIDAFEIRINETDCGTSDTVTIEEELPLRGRIISCKCQLVSGTGAQVNPQLSQSSDFGGVDKILEYETTDPDTDNVNFAPGDGGAICIVKDGALYHQSRPDSGSDNVIQTIYILKVGL